MISSRNLEVIEDYKIYFSNTRNGFHIVNIFEGTVLVKCCLVKKGVLFSNRGIAYGLIDYIHKGVII